MNGLNAKVRTILLAFFLGAAALVFYGAGNYVSANYHSGANNDTSQLSIDGNMQPLDFVALKNLIPGSPYCPPGGCAVCGGCSTQYFQTVSYVTAPVTQVSTGEAASSVWNSCPRGLVNCRYPGKCNLYIDTNKDSICDRSQSAPQQLKTTASPTTNPVPAIIAGIGSSPLAGGNAGTVNSSPDTVVTKPTTVNAEVQPESSSSAVASTAAVSSTTDFSIAPSASSTTADSSTPAIVSQTAVASRSSFKNSYFFLPIILGLAVFYILTWVLSMKRKISTVVHRRIWNLVLLVSTLVSTLLGVILILRLDFGIYLTLPFNMLFWHVEAGIALGVIAVFHILWHWRYFTKMLKVGAASEKTTRIQTVQTVGVQSSAEAGNNPK